MFAWLDEPFEATLPLAPRLRLYALCGGLVVGSVPFLHLYLEVDLTAAELVVHAIDISLGTFIVLGLTEAITSWLQGSLTWRVSVSRKALIALSALGVGAILSLQSLLHDWLPMTETIRSKHVDAGYGDMSLRVLPVVALIGVLVAQGVRGRLLRGELEALRALNARLAARVSGGSGPASERVGFRHEGREVLLDPAWITRVQAEENYCRIHVSEPDGPPRSLLVRATLAETIARLPAPHFVQVHRSHVVATRHVAEVLREGRSAELRLDDGSRVPVSRSRLAEVRGRLHDSLAVAR